MNKSLFCIVLLLIWGSACSGAEQYVPNPDPTEQQKPLVETNTGSLLETATAQAYILPTPSTGTSIGDILSQPDHYVNQSVEITGYFRGWDLLKEVEGTPPFTRSDWVIKDDSGAIYVTGGLPPHLDPSSLQDTNTIIRLVATVAENQNIPYLQAISVEVVPTQE